MRENVFALPGSCFQAPGFVRLVCCAPVDVMAEAVKRIRAFCERRHGKQQLLSASAASDAAPNSGSGKGMEEEEKR